MIDIRKYEEMMMFNLEDEEREELGRRLGELVDSFTALEKVDTGSAEPLVTVLNGCNILREDISEKLMARDELLLSAPEQHDGYFKVPETL